MIKLAEKEPSRPFQGMMPIMATAMTRQGELDEASQRRMVQYCLQCGAVAIGHFGYASEFFKLSDTDRQQLIRLIVDEVAGRVPVFIGVTAASTRIAVEYARMAEALGADLVMAGLPHIQLPDAAGAMRYYGALSNATQLPIIVQDVPASSAILNPDLLARMYRELEHVAYVKAEGREFLAKGVAIREATQGGLSVIGGAGGRHMLHMLHQGITSFMTGTEALDLHAGIVAAYLRGDEETAAQLYYEYLLPYFMFYECYPDELLKQMLLERGVIDCASVIEPDSGLRMSAVERKEFDWVLERIGWKKNWGNRIAAGYDTAPEAIVAHV